MATPVMNRSLTFSALIAGFFILLLVLTPALASGGRQAPDRTRATATATDGRSAERPVRAERTTRAPVATAPTGERPVTERPVAERPAREPTTVISIPNAPGATVFVPLVVLIPSGWDVPGMAAGTMTAAEQQSAVGHAYGMRDSVAASTANHQRVSIALDIRYVGVIRSASGVYDGWQHPNRSDLAPFLGGVSPSLDVMVFIPGRAFPTSYYGGIVNYWSQYALVRIDTNVVPRIAVHEWIHLMEGRLMTRGYRVDYGCTGNGAVPFLHDGGGCHGWYGRGGLGWFDAWLTAQIPRPGGGGFYGMTPELWRAIA